MAKDTNAIATQKEAKLISRSSQLVTDNRMCTKEVAVNLECAVRSEYEDKQLVKYSDLYYISDVTTDVPDDWGDHDWEYFNYPPLVQLISVYHTPLEVRITKEDSYLLLNLLPNDGTAYFVQHGADLSGSTCLSELLGDLSVDVAMSEKYNPINCGGYGIDPLVTTSSNVDILFRYSLDYFSTTDSTYFPILVYNNVGELLITLNLPGGVGTDPRGNAQIEDTVFCKWLVYGDHCYVLFLYRPIYTFDERKLASVVIVGNVAVPFKYDTQSNNALTENVYVSANNKVCLLPTIELDTEPFVTDVITNFNQAGNINVVGINFGTDTPALEYKIYFKAYSLVDDPIVTLGLIDHVNNVYYGNDSIPSNLVNIDCSYTPIDISMVGLTVPEENLFSHHLVGTLNDECGPIAFPLNYLHDDENYVLSGDLLEGEVWHGTICVRPQFEGIYILGLTLNGKTYLFLLNYDFSISETTSLDLVTLNDLYNGLNIEYQSWYADIPYELSNILCWKDGLMKDYYWQNTEPAVVYQPESETLECVTQGTLILTDLDGTTKKVEDLLIGDLIVTFNDGENIVATIDKVISTTHNYYIRITLDSGKVLDISIDHAIYTKDGWKAFEPRFVKDKLNVSALQRSDEIYTIDGYTKIINIKVMHIPNTTMYNIGIAGHNDYYANGILVHECL